MKPICRVCGDTYAPLRHAAGYKVCLPCGEKKARERSFCVAPMHKSNYQLITNPADLLGLNNKGGLIK